MNIFHRHRRIPIAELSPWDRMILYTPRRRLKQRSAVWFALFAWALVIFLAVHVKLAADTPGNPFALMADEFIDAMFGGK
jgi:hypothetical protein